MQPVKKALQAWRIQQRVIVALMIRELTTRFGRENIGFLWIMAEPMLFAVLVGTMYSIMIGEQEHGVGVIAFVASGYIPLTVMRNSFGRIVSIFLVNGALLYHRQVRVLDFILVRFLIEMVGGMMAYLFVGTLLIAFDLFPVPAHIGFFLAGWSLYMLFVFSLCLVIAPLSEMSEVLEKLMPVTVYIAIPLSGTFNMVSWLAPAARDVVLWSPFVNGMEMMRYGLFGDAVRPYYNIWVPLGASAVLAVIGLALCRRVRRTLVVE
ncbi:ABC transporter permease [Novosphingobium sp. Leaf2]|uniref:ABC transporter permease n=1 Tax=Novosphingobium sp. Leaf2 TaxID=1735670 RepID=UPI0006F8C2A6|nr:ABC transporter permease [Novosphingobium sp. Leaf2]KQM18290.1 capsule biosynthesis protein [Novosphingobium sp. Leaf2]